MLNIQTIKWANADTIKRIFGVNRRDLLSFEEDGFIRSYKNGVSQQSQKVYCCEDVDDLLKRRSAGKTPVIKRGRV